MFGVCGARSGNLACLDFDQPGYCDEWQRLIPDELYNRLYIEESQRSGGYHVTFRVAETVPSSQPARDPRKADGTDGKVRIEVRGEGNGFVAAPSVGYNRIQGDLANLPVLTIEEYRLLIDAAATFNECEPRPTVEREPRPARPADADERRGDRYNREATQDTVLDLFRKHGWAIGQRAGRNVDITRPGATTETSGNVNREGIACIFSTNTEFETSKGHAPFTVYTTLEHGGDFTEAARVLGREYDKTDGKTMGPKRLYRQNENAANEPQEGTKNGPTPIRDDIADEPNFYSDKGKLMPDEAAEYFVRQGGTCFVGINDAAKPYLYNTEAGIYEEDTSNRLADRIRQAAAHGYSEPNQRGQITRALREHGGIHHRILPVDEMTAEIVVENGTLNLETMQLRPWTADEVFFRGLPVAWKPAVPADAYERLDTFLADVMPDADDRSLFWEYIGGILYRKHFYRGILYFIGPHGSGKSSVYDLVLDVLGKENFSSQNAQQMNEESFGLSPLVGALANVCSDAGSDVRLIGTGNLKTLGTGEPVGINRKGQPYLTARLHVPLMFSANDLPQFSGGDEAFRSRVLVVMSGPTRAPGDQKPGIVGELAGDMNVRSAFLNRALEGLARLRERGNYLRSETMLARTAEMMTINDEVRQFLADEAYVRISGDEANSVSAHDLYEAYKSWKKENDPHSKAMSAIGFTRKVTSLVADKVISGMTRPDEAMRGDDGKRYRGYRGIWVVPRVEADNLFSGR
jgi:P4 family phage/plasmid primase-like protien